MSNHPDSGPTEAPRNDRHRHELRLTVRLEDYGCQPKDACSLLHGSRLRFDIGSVSIDERANDLCFRHQFAQQF
jgi:hypothetical protein